MKKALYRLIFFRLMGWRITGHMDPAIRKSVLMVMPHTSWRDFYIGLFARGIIGMEMHYVAKKELFRFPFGGWFRWMGGQPLDRTGNQNTVDAIVEIFGRRDPFRMAIAPEGTRKKVDSLKTGFYYIAHKAGVPIIPIAFDYGARTLKIGNPFTPSGSIETDLPILLRHFVGVTGKFPARGFGAGQTTSHGIDTV